MNKNLLIHKANKTLKSEVELNVKQIQTRNKKEKGGEEKIHQLMLPLTKSNFQT